MDMILHWIVVGFLIAAGWWLFDHWFLAMLRDGWNLIRRKPEAKSPLSSQDYLATISRQLRNLYVLTASEQIPLPHLYEHPFKSQSRLDMWQRLNLYRVLGEGVEPEDADSAGSAHILTNIWDIAGDTGDRIRYNCKKSSRVEDLCPSCAAEHSDWKREYDDRCALKRASKEVREWELWHPVLRDCPVSEAKAE